MLVCWCCVHVLVLCVTCDVLVLCVTCVVVWADVEKATEGTLLLLACEDGWVRGFDMRGRKQVSI